MGDFVSKLVTEAGVRPASQRGGLTYCNASTSRPMFELVSTEETERFELALAMKHTPLATLKYVREFAIRELTT